MSVGGIVVFVEPVGDGVTRVYTNEPDFRSSVATCVNCRGGEKIRPGDSCWWQSGKVYWTPVGGEYPAIDFPLEKVGYSYSRELPP